MNLAQFAIDSAPDIAEVPQKAVALHLPQPVTGCVTLDACCPGVLLDGEEPVPVNEVEAERCRIGERERQRRHVVQPCFTPMNGAASPVAAAGSGAAAGVSAV